MRYPITTVTISNPTSDKLISFYRPPLDAVRHLKNPHVFGIIYSTRKHADIAATNSDFDHDPMIVSESAFFVRLYQESLLSY